MTTQNKVIAGVVVVSLISVAALFSSKGGDATKRLGAQIEQETYWFYNGMQLGPAGTTQDEAQISMGSGQNQASWQNATGQTIYIDSGSVLGILTPGASSTAAVTASTSMLVYAGTSTSAAVANATIPIYGSIWGNVSIATSTKGSTALSSVQNGVSASTTEQGIVAVPNGSYVLFVMNAVNAPPIGESATSTNRGFNLLIDVPYSTQ